MTLFCSLITTGASQLSVVILASQLSVGVLASQLSVGILASQLSVGILASQLSVGILASQLSVGILASQLSVGILASQLSMGFLALCGLFHCDCRSQHVLRVPPAGCSITNEKERKRSRPITVLATVVIIYKTPHVISVFLCLLFTASKRCCISREYFILSVKTMNVNYIIMFNYPFCVHLSVCVLLVDTQHRRYLVHLSVHVFYLLTHTVDDT